MNVSWNDVNPTLRGLLMVLVAIQLALIVIALIRLQRTPDDRVALLPRWAWVLIIVFGELVGPIVFLAAGRSPQRAEPPPSSSAPRGDAVDRAVDVLYGDAPGAEGTRR